MSATPLNVQEEIEPDTLEKANKELRDLIDRMNALDIKVSNYLEEHGPTLANSARFGSGSICANNPMLPNSKVDKEDSFDRELQQFNRITSKYNERVKEILIQIQLREKELADVTQSSSKNPGFFNVGTKKTQSNEEYNCHEYERLKKEFTEIQNKVLCKINTLRNLLNYPPKESAPFAPQETQPRTEGGQAPVQMGLRH